MKSSFHVTCNLNFVDFTKIDILFFKRSKETKRGKKLTNFVSNQCHNKTNLNLVRSVPYPLALTNQYVVRNLCTGIIVTSLFSETKGFFCFSFYNRSPKDAAWKLRVVCIHYFSKTKSKPTKKKKKIQRECFSVQLKMICKVSIAFAAKKALKIVT